MIELLLYLYAESPLHPGGADSLGVLDLPIQRESTTQYPVIWGQSLKGALRQAATAAWTGDTATVTELFGSGIDDGEDNTRKETSAGQLRVGDAQLVAMPVPTLRRTFAWATSQLALARLARKYRVLSGSTTLPAPPTVADDRGLAGDPYWLRGATGGDEILGPCLLALGETASPDLAAWATHIAADVFGTDPLFAPMKDKLGADLLLVGADVMPTLLTECTEFVARVQLNSGKTVQNGPFYCEYLPVETILAASVTLRDTPRTAHHLDQLRELCTGGPLQIGGDETIGKGLAWTQLVEAKR